MTQFNQEIIHATLPWRSPFASDHADLRKLRRASTESQADIDECLSCPKPYCTNCKRQPKNRYGYATMQKGAV